MPPSRLPLYRERHTELGRNHCLTEASDNSDNSDKSAQTKKVIRDPY
jgi:hypothetical protein